MREGSPRRRRTVVALAVLASCWIGCGQGSRTGPGEIHWDRQTCEHCRMVISERRDAVQVRKTGESRTHAFDDLGCALLWLDDQPSLEADDRTVEIWVEGPSGAGWIDARTARFEGRQSTPMAYGFASAVEGIPLDAVHARVRAIERRRRGGAVGAPEASAGRKEAARD